MEARVTAQLYLNIKSGDALVFRPGGLERARGVFDEQWAQRVHELDSDLVTSSTTKMKFERSVERAGAEVAAVLQGVNGVTRWLTDHAESHNWVIASPVDGLKLPFELLHGDENKTPLLLKTGVARRIQGFTVPEALRRPIPALLMWLAESEQPIRVLLVGADASGLLPVEQEIARVRRRIESGAAAFQLECEIVEVPPELASADRVRKEFERRSIHLFHFCGHGYQEGNEGGIVLNTSGQAERVSSGQLGAWMIDKGLWLAYLSACRTAAVSGDGLILSSGLLQDVLSAGVPNVVGFRWPVTWKSGLVLAEEFYCQLFEPPRGSDPATAMLRARRAAKGMADLSDAWASSVIVTQCPA
jgi:CHAT domain